MHCIEENSDHNLKVFYPGFEAVVPPLRTCAVRAWKGKITPLPDNSELGKIVQDLDRHAVVDLDVGGCLRHSAECKRGHTAPVLMTKLGNSAVEYEVLGLEFAGRCDR